MESNRALKIALRDHGELFTAEELRFVKLQKQKHQIESR